MNTRNREPVDLIRSASRESHRPYRRHALDDERKRLVRHKRKATSQVTVMDHFDELEIGAAMVLRPIWFAYRPQETAEQRAASSTFARHGTAHHIRGRQISKRNAAQAVMLVAALLDLLAVLDRA